MTFPLFFAGTAIDPATGMAIFSGLSFLTHLTFSILVALPLRALLPRPYRKKAFQYAFWTFFLTGGLYLFPIVTQPIYPSQFIRDYIELLLIGYAVFGLSITVLTFLFFRKRP